MPPSAAREASGTERSGSRERFYRARVDVEFAYDECRFGIDGRKRVYRAHVSRHGDIDVTHRISASSGYTGAATHLLTGYRNSDNIATDDGNSRMILVR